MCYLQMQQLIDLQRERYYYLEKELVDYLLPGDTSQWLGSNTKSCNKTVLVGCWFSVGMELTLILRPVLLRQRMEMKPGKQVRVLERGVRYSGNITLTLVMVWPGTAQAAPGPLAAASSGSGMFMVAVQYHLRPWVLLESTRAAASANLMLAILS